MGVASLRRSDPPVSFGGEHTGKNPTDRGKQGSQRHTLTEGRGVPWSVTVSAANVNDHLMADATLKAARGIRPPPTKQRPQHLCVDWGDDNQPTHKVILQHGYIGHFRRSGTGGVEGVQPKPPARRWVVERTPSWHNRYRRLKPRWEKKVDNDLGLIHFACAITAYRVTFLG